MILQTSATSYVKPRSRTVITTLRKTTASSSWGLIPRPKVMISLTGRPPIDAHTETIEEEVIFRDVFDERRCLVFVDDSYECHGDASPKIPTDLSTPTTSPLPAWSNRMTRIMRRLPTHPSVRFYGVVTISSSAHDGQPSTPSRSSMICTASDTLFPQCLQTPIPWTPRRHPSGRCLNHMSVKYHRWQTGTRVDSPRASITAPSD